MEKVNISAKSEGDELTHQEFNSLVGGVNSIIDTLNGSTSVQRNIRVTNNLESKNVSTQKGEPCILNFTFISQERYSYNDPYENTGERGFCQILLKSSGETAFELIKEINVNSGIPFTFDVSEYLSSGTNQIMVKITGEVTGETTPAFVYTVQLTSLSISANNFKWWTAYNGNITLPLNIGGNINKTLHVSVTGNGHSYKETYIRPLGTNVYTETAFNFSVPHPNMEGIFRVEAYVSSMDDTVRTKTVAFNVMCSMPVGINKLIAINNMIGKATNWMTNTLFEYSMYDGDNAYTSAEFIIKKDGVPVFSSHEDNISTSAKHSFVFSMEVETIDNSEFEIEINVLDGNTPLIEPVTVSVNNSSGYSATAGAVFYLNPKTRSNRQQNYRSIINEMDGSEIAGIWNNVNWGNDGWIEGSEGSKVLRLMAGSQLKVDYFPFKKECARTGKTIEVDYRIDNVTDVSEPAFTIATAKSDSFVGLKLYPDDIVMHTQSLKNTGVQSIHTDTNKRIRLSLVIMPDAYGNSGFNLCILYVNGKKNREFTYENNDYFAHNGGIVIGSNYADIDIYGLRIYDSALTSSSILRNYINWLVDTTEKAEVKNDNDVMDSNGSEVDFENTIDQYNVLVFDNTIPSIVDTSKRIGTLEIYFADYPEKNVKISNVEAKGQGTSSMKYYKWNTKYSIDKSNSVITYADGSTGGKTWKMTEGIPAAAKFTAKKNYASSMQSHKMGSVNSVQDLYKKLGLTNEAMQTSEYPDARIAVYQMPFICFQKSLNEEEEIVYTFQGEYTFGPDKGDKYTFGYDTDLFPGLISIEGSDNSPLATLFRVPWNSRIVYNADEEAFQYNGANAWDFDGGQETNIDKWIPAYNLVYSCSNRLKPFNGTLDELNAQASMFRTEPYEFWIAKAGDVNQYNVYYYESGENRFISSDIGNGAVNLISQLVDRGYGLTSIDINGKTNEELNTLFINARIIKFGMEASSYWDITDAIFHRNWVEMHAGTDNRAKNTYPYSFGGTDSKWKWRFDDLDTIFDTDNEGQPEKGYGVEFHDVTKNGAAVWNGETSNFWNLIDLAFSDKIISEMKRMLTAMEELSDLKGGTDYDKLLAYYKKYYFDPVQQHFPANIVNADAKFTYENGKLAYMNGSYTNDTDPIAQSLGDHFSAEMRWISKRIIYIMSKYSFGMFSANGTDTITVRAAGNTIKYELTPAIDMYPTIANGTSIIRGERTKAGDKCEILIELSGSGDQQNTIQAASFLQDIGDWHDKNISGTMGIQGKMLREIRLGSKTEPITISIAALNISNCVSLQNLILSNIKTLTGSLNLTACTHLRKVYADGTSLTQIQLPQGGGLQHIEFSADNQYLSLANYPLLTNEGVNISLCKSIITDFYIVNCSLMNPMQLLVDVMNSQVNQENHALQHIRVVNFDETYNSEMLDVLAKLADGTYSGLSSDGLAGEDEFPVLDGSITINGNCYEDSVNALKNTFGKLSLNVNGEFYIRFADKEILDICAVSWGDGKGITKEQAALVTTLGNKFQGNLDITSFDEFQNFTSIKRVGVNSGYGVFGKSSLKSIILPVSLIESVEEFSLKQAFRDCVNLEKVVYSIPPYQINDGMCPGCTSLNYIEGINWENITNFGGDALTECPLFNIKVLKMDNLLVIGTGNTISHAVGPRYIKLGKIKIFGSSSYQSSCIEGCENLEVLVIGEEIKTINYWSIINCPRTDIYIEAIIPPQTATVFNRDMSPTIYVPMEAVTAYKSAPGWSAGADRIVGYDFSVDLDCVDKKFVASDWD